MHEINMCVVALAEDLGAQALKSSVQMNLQATHRERRRVPRKTGDGACRDMGSGALGVERIGSDGKLEAFSLLGARRSSREVPKFEQHVYY